MMQVEPVTLQGRHVRLEPPAEKHVDQLLIAGKSEGIWTYLPYGPFTSRAEWIEWLRTLSERMNRGESLPFVTIRLSDERAVGMTCYLYISRPDRSLEIGGTWLMPEAQRSVVNTESKYLLLRHAFETLGCIRVQLKTDSRNTNSQRAIERLGARKEGVLRKHMIVKNGFQRDSVIYSIIDSEWPEVKARLEAILYSQRG